MRLKLRAIACFFLILCFQLHADTLTQKITPEIKMSYTSIDGIKFIHVQILTQEQTQQLPVANMIVNLSLAKRRKYNPLRSEGWMGNKLTNANGIAEFTLPDQAYKLRPDRHEFEFIANIGTDPLYQDTEARLKIRDVFFRFEFDKKNGQINLLVKLSEAQNKKEVALPNADFELFLNDSLNEYRIGSKAWTSDEHGEKVIVFPEDLIDKIQPGSFLTAKYSDKVNKGEVIVNQKLPDEISRQSSIQKLINWSRLHLISILVFIGSAVALFLTIFSLKRTKQA